MLAEEGSMIINSSVTGHLVAGASRVGGLVGTCRRSGNHFILCRVRRSQFYVFQCWWFGWSWATDVTIRLSYALTDMVMIVGENGGGLIGRTT